MIYKHLKRKVFKYKISKKKGDKNHKCFYLCVNTCCDPANVTVNAWEKAQITPNLKIIGQNCGSFDPKIFPSILKIKGNAPTRGEPISCVCRKQEVESEFLKYRRNMAPTCQNDYTFLD